ncbi:hypothetical protein B0T14DRAFT_229429 [Immersiella caudata]|uniref:Uncharacterized protein n=1 Tax=Immersiella caudata TaxID=314043 RepID=A0AA39WRS3_9PEZI|nr:hypothetical protein B0T14DRAFT_229429 [Immersiella caudata]
MLSRRLECVREMSSKVSGIRFPPVFRAPDGIACGHPRQRPRSIRANAWHPRGLCNGIMGTTPPPRNGLEQFPKLENQAAGQATGSAGLLSLFLFLAQRPCDLGTEGVSKGWGGWSTIWGGALSPLSTTRMAPPCSARCGTPQHIPDDEGGVRLYRALSTSQPASQMHGLARTLLFVANLTVNAAADQGHSVTAWQPQDVRRC